MKNTSTRRLVMAALFAALTTVATLIIQIPITPTRGYINLGDCIVLLCGWVLSPLYGVLAAGVGSMLSDLISGYAYYAPATFVIKALMALVAGAVFHLSAGREHKHLVSACVISGVLAECIMIAGYCAFEYLILGLGPAALLGIPGNVIQALAGAASATVVLLLLRRNKALRDRMDHF